MTVTRVLSIKRVALGLGLAAGLGAGLLLWSHYGLAIMLTGGLSLCF